MKHREKNAWKKKRQSKKRHMGYTHKRKRWAYS